MKSKIARRRILKNWDEEQDTLYDSPDTAGQWWRVENKAFYYNHGRGVSVENVQRALDRIKEVLDDVERIPFQLQYHMALPLWERFAEEYCDTGDVEKALRAI